jgi:hypothetical protein
MNLLPCPFCGGPAVLRSDGERADLPHFVRCDNLLCCGFNTSNGVRTPEIAAKAWNERAPLSDAYSDLMGQIRAMKSRSDQYLSESVPGSDEAEKHARVSSVLKELQRLGEAFAQRRTP